jgi:hypothetical protein
MNAVVAWGGRMKGAASLRRYSYTMCRGTVLLRPARAAISTNVQISAGPRSSPLLLALFAAIAVFGSAARAHDIYTSWTETFVRADRLEMTLTLSRSSALRLIPDANALPPITTENFSAYSPRLKTIAPQLFELTSAGKPLTLSSSRVEISGDADITFHLIYPRPAAGATLRFVAQYLFHLVDGHVGTLVVNDAAGKDLGWSPVSVDQPAFELRVPAVAPATRSK